MKRALSNGDTMTKEQQLLEKRNSGHKAAEFVEDGMVLGLGTGSTVYYFLEALRDRIREEKLEIIGIPTSIATHKQAQEWQIPLTTLAEQPQIDLTVDGADEMDHEFNLIKGGGGALVREKIVAAASKRELIIMDSSKYVNVLGAFPLPVEVVQYGIEATTLKLERFCPELKLRKKEGKPFVTDNGNYILDCAFGQIPNPGVLETTLDLIPGVVECGLFVGLSDLAVIGRGKAVEVLRK